MDDTAHTSLIRARLLSLPLGGEDAVVVAMFRFASPTSDGLFFRRCGDINVTIDERIPPSTRDGNEQRSGEDGAMTGVDVVVVS